MAATACPHFTVGFEDGRAGHPRYRFQDALYQQRYDLGYDCGVELLTPRRAEGRCECWECRNAMLNNRRPPHAR